MPLRRITLEKGSFLPPWKKWALFEALYSNDKLGLENPESLVNTAWFYIVLYFGKRGRENQREMKASDLQLKTTTGGLKYFVLNERATKNHRGGISDNEDETQSVTMAWSGRPRCPVTCLENYLAKREPRCDACLVAKSKESQCRIVLSKWWHLLLQHSDGKAQAWQSTQGNVQESWCRNYIYSSLHPSYLSDSPQRCRFGKESSEVCNEPFKRQFNRVVQHTTNHRAAIRVVYNSQSLHSKAESNPILCFLPFHLLRNLFQPRFSSKINHILFLPRLIFLTQPFTASIPRRALHNTKHFWARLLIRFLWPIRTMCLKRHIEKTSVFSSLRAPDLWGVVKSIN